MTSKRLQAALSSLAAACVLAACGGSQKNGAASRQSSDIAGAEGSPAKKQAPPASGPAKDVSFPPIVRHKLDSGLELNTVAWRSLPLVYVRLVIKSGGETDPEKLPGLSSLVASMMKEGTKKLSSQQLAESIEFLGADLGTGADQETLYVSMRALSSDFDEAMRLLSEVVQSPAFRSSELNKLKKRELDRLALQANDPGYIAAREFNARMYGEHPYARIDTTPEAVDAVTAKDLKRWHSSYVVPNNAFLVVVGDVSAEQVKATSESLFAKWKKKDVKAPSYPALPKRSSRHVVLVDRPESVQSVILMGNPALDRNSKDYVPLLVANQVLGGSAASRLFMDLREKRSLTYGAYSRVTERVDKGVFRAGASVRTEVTKEALSAFDEHLERIVREKVPAAELKNAQRYLSDRFPLQIDTPGSIASMVAELRVYDLPDDYWDQYRSEIRGVTTDQAFSAAKKYITPNQQLVVVVGNAQKVSPQVKSLGKVDVVSATASTDKAKGSKKPKSQK